MAYLTQAELEATGFKVLGKNVKISSRAAIYNPETIAIGDNSRIDDFCVISGNVELGKYVHIAAHCLIAGGEKGVVMHDFSGLAYYVQVFSQSDDYTGQTLTNPTVPAKYKKEKKAQVVLERHVIIGAGSIIMPGVTVAEGCSLGAMTMLRKSTAPWGIYVGNPAKRLSERSQDMLKIEAQLLQDLADQTASANSRT